MGTSGKPPGAADLDRHSVELAAWAKAHGGAELIERRPIKPFGVYTLVRFCHLGQGAGHSLSHAA
jgi:hypothetical protein